jgi:hypothetical protein
VEPQGGTLGDFVRYIALDTDVAPLAAFADSEILYGEKQNAANDVRATFAKFDKNQSGKLEGATLCRARADLCTGAEITALLTEALGWPNPMPCDQR